MEPLRFACSYKPKDVDFRIIYSNPSNWNDYGYYTRYKLYADGPIAGNNLIFLGWIHISSTKQSQNEVDYVGKIMGKEPFFTLEDSFYSAILDAEVAQKLFMLLSPEQRSNFLSALNLSVHLDEDVWRFFHRYYSLWGGMFRNCSDNAFYSNNDIIVRYLKSEIDYRSLPKL